MPDGNNPKQVSHLALMPVCGRDRCRQGRHFRAGGIYRHDQRHKLVRGIRCSMLEDITHLQIAIRHRRLVRCYDGSQRHGELSSQPGDCTGKIGLFTETNGYIRGPWPGFGID